MAVRLISLEAARRGRLRLVLEGREDLYLARDVVYAAGLRQDDLLEDDQLTQLVLQASREEARGRALRFLETRERTAKELADRLRRYGYEADVVESTVAWCVELGYVDDGRFAAAYVREKRRAGWGPRRLRTELARKGVARAVVDEAVTEMTSADLPDTDTTPAVRAGGDTDAVPAGPGLLDGSRATGSSLGVAEEPPEQLLLRLVTKKFGARIREDRQGGRNRAAAFLARRGHDWEVIERVLILAERALEESDDTA
jgi:SOS response regulatory protein OraA/RecX